MNLSNEDCRVRALRALDAENPEVAIAWVNAAYASTLGHAKSERYERWGDSIAREYGIERHGKYPRDFGIKES